MTRRAKLFASASIGVLALAVLPEAARAQAIWQSSTTDYNTAANWSTNNVPDAGGESAAFQDTGTTTVVVNTAVTPDSWTFAANAQSYGISGAEVTFAAGGGIANSASTNQTISNVIGGSGNLVQNGTGTLTLTGANTYTGTTTLTAGALTIGFFGSIASNVVNNATFRNDGTVTGSVANAGAIANTSSGRWNGDVTSNSGTIINIGAWRGTLTNPTGLVGNSGAWTGNITNANVFTNEGVVLGDVTNSGTFSQSDTFTGLISHNGLYGNLTNTGLVIARRGIFGGDITNNGTGVFTVIGNVTSNGSAFNNNGFGMLNLETGSFTGLGAVTNSSRAIVGINVSSGRTLRATSVTNNSGATLINNGTIASTLMVNGGTIAGTGTFVGNSTFNGGFLSPGNSIGTLTFQGNLVLTAASTYLIEVDPSASDRTNVIGTATLGGATVAATFAPGSYVARRYTILNATGGVSGTFGSLVNSNLPATFASSLSYDANNAYLDLALGVPNFGNSLSGNQLNVANALVRSFNAAGGIPLAFGALNGQGLTIVSGEAATGSQQATFDAMGQFTDMLTDPFMRTRTNARGTGANSYASEDEALGYAAKRKGRNPAEQDAYAAMTRKAPVRESFERRWSVWGGGFGGTQSTDGNATVGSTNTTSRVFGGVAGFDYRVTPNTLIGFAMGGGGSNFGLANGLGGGRSDLFQAGLYGCHEFDGGYYVAGSLAYGWQDITTDRNVFLNQYRANFDASSLSGRLETGVRIPVGVGVIAPYAAGRFVTFWLPDYAEQVVAGANLFALNYQSRDVTSSRTELGLRGETSFASGDATITLRSRAAWAHNFDTGRGISASFLSLPASGFVVNGAAPAREAALVSAGAEARWLNGFSVAGTFEGEFSRVTESFGGKGTLRYQW